MCPSPARIDERGRPAADASTRAVVADLATHRRALVEGDVARVEETTLWAARPPWERDLFIDLAAASGLDVAVKRLRQFWKLANPILLHVRPLPDGDVEVFEQIHMPDGRELHTVTLMRPVGDRYLVVAMSEAPDDTTRFLVLTDSESPALDDARFTREWIEAHGPTAELLVDANDGALGHPLEGWLARVRGPLPWAPIRERLTRRTLELPDAKTVLEVVMTPSGDPRERAHQLLWLALAAAEVAQHIGASLVYVQRAEKLIRVETLKKTMTGPAVGGREVASAYVKLVEKGKWAATRGMGQLVLPELEVDLEEFPDPGAARRLLGAVSVALIEGRVAPIPSARHVLTVAGYRCQLALGRRGAEPGQTYGRFGALVIRPADRNDEKARTGPRLKLEI
jgi:hypothetical protein